MPASADTSGRLMNTSQLTAVEAPAAKPTIGFFERYLTV